MIQKLYKGSDAIIKIKLTDKLGVPFRICNVNKFSLKFYTTDPNKYVECTYENSIYNGILAGEAEDSAILNANDLNILDRGIIKYIYTIQVNNDVFDDGIYDEIMEGSTNIYLT